MLIWTGAVRVARRGPACGKLSRALVFRSRCRSRSMTVRRRARPASARSRQALVSAAGRLAVAAPERVAAMTVRRAAVKEISRGWTGWPARRPLRAGTAFAAAARAVARASSTEITQAACSWRIRAGDCDRRIGPVDGPAPLIADLASFSAVSDPIHDMRDFWEFLGHRGLDWREARLEDVGEFVAWLRLPPPVRAGTVAVLPSAMPQVGVSTINRKLATVSAFYTHQSRNGADAGDLLAAWRAGGRGGWKPFLHHVNKGRPHRGRAITLKTDTKLPRS